ncbi:MAG: acid stress-induced BolA-like protein IbaG/YrbA [Gammaproteobacteria bacterium]|jgi:acid stress-induced BolA-like protein IbaG/YrbA
MGIDEIKSCIEDGMPGADVLVDGDGTHFSAIVVSTEFAGKSMVQQHQIVYKTLGNKVGNEIHALAIKTFTPDDWKKEKDLRVV